MTRNRSVIGALALIISFNDVMTVSALRADVIPGPGAAQTMDYAGFAKQVKPFLDQYCVACHSPMGQEADLALDAFTDQESLTNGIPILDKAVQMLRQQKMPPKGEVQPTDTEKKAALEWLEAYTSGVDCSKPESINPGRVTLRRLNRAEYNNTVRDLLGIDYRPADSFPVDDAGYGFDNIGDVLSIAPVLMEKYMTSAEVVMHQAIMVDPVVPPPSHRWDANVAEGSVPKTKAVVQSRGAQEPLYAAEAGNGRVFYYDGEIHTEYDFPADGTYFLRLRGYSNAGTTVRTRPQVQFYVDGEPFGKPLTVNDDQRLTRLYGTSAEKITAGKHKITLALISNGTREEYEAAVEAARLAALAAATQPAATQPHVEVALNVPAQPQGDQPQQRPQPQAGQPQAPPGGRQRGPAGVAGARRGGRGRGPEIPPAPPSPTGKSTLGVHFIEVEGPLEPTPDRMPDSYRRVMVTTPSPTITKQQAAEQIIRNFTTKAYRRPVKDDEVQRLMALWTGYDADGDKFEESISNTLAVVLASPHFLYRVERDPTAEEGPVRTLDEYELASRLSYFLWSSMPDGELSSLAEQGKLRANLDAQIARMLQDPKSRALVDNFAGQWLQLRMMGNVIPDPKLFPDFDPALRAAMTTETQMFFETIIKEDRNVLDFIDADFTFLNERLAKHYGIEGIKGEEFQRVNLTSPERGGLLTQGSILTITSYANRTSPVQRGKWVLENLLDSAPPPPPPNVPPLKDQGEIKGTLRERMVQHRENPTCAACHEQMDAIGFGLENFNAIGAWRTNDGDSPIDPAGVLPGGVSFKGPADLKRIIRSHSEEFSRALASKMMTYAIGRGMEKFDRCSIDPIVTRMKQNGYKFSVLVREIVHSDPFQKRSAK